MPRKTISSGSVNANAGMETLSDTSPRSSNTGHVDTIIPDSNGTIPASKSDIDLPFHPHRMEHSSERASNFSLSSLSALSDALTYNATKEYDAKEEDDDQWLRYFELRSLLADAEPGSLLHKSHKDRKEDLKHYRRIWIKEKWSYILLRRKFIRAKGVARRSRLRCTEQVEKYKRDIQKLQRKNEELEWMVNHLIEDAEVTEKKLELTGNHVADLEDAVSESQRTTAELQRHNDLLQDELAAWKPISWPPASYTRFSTDRQG